MKAPSDTTGKLADEDQRSYAQLAAKPMNFSGYERDRFFLSCRGQRFRSLGYSAGLDYDHDGRSTLPVDVDGDGDLDLVVMSLQRLQLLENRTPAGAHFVRFELEARKTERHALGAVVRVRTASTSQVDRITATSGFSAGVPLLAHFGLGTSAAPAEVEVRWPSGATERFGAVAVDRQYRLVEGSGRAVGVEIPRWPSRLEDVAGREAFRLPDTMTALDGTSRSTRAEVAGPTIVNFWATWCEACKREIPKLAKLAAAGRVRVVGVSVDEDAAAAAAFVAARGMKYENFRADEASVRRFFGAEGRIQLPATFVLDAEGALRRAMYREVGVEDLEAALATVEAVALSAGDARIAYDRGTFALEHDRLDDAIAALQLAVKIAPSMGEAHANLGNAYSKRGSLGQALEAYRNGAALAPDYAPLHYNLGVSLAKAKRFPEAVEAYRRALALDPKYPGAQYNLGIAFGRMSRWDESIAASRAAVEQLPTHAEAWFNLGLAQQGKRDLVAAAQAFEKAVLHKRDFAQAYVSLAECLAATGRRDDAVYQLQQALRVSPGHPQAQQLLMRLGGPPR